MIDVHTHLLGTPIEILTYMDWFNIDAAVVLGCIGQPPEALVKVCGRYPDRLIPFYIVKPTDAHKAEKIKKALELGARGYGEHKLRRRIDDPKSKEIYRICSGLRIPILVHLGWEGSGWNPDIHGFEKMVAEFPDTTFIAHGEGWWREISSDVPKASYPTGKIEPGGKVDYILEMYPNVYADLSARSGSNALSRDVDFARSFVERYKNRLLFGTDFYQRVFKRRFLIYTPFKVVDNLNLPANTHRKITHDNAARLLGL